MALLDGRAAGPNVGRLRARKLRNLASSSNNSVGRNWAQPNWQQQLSLISNIMSSTHLGVDQTVAQRRLDCCCAIFVNLLVDIRWVSIAIEVKSTLFHQIYVLASRTRTNYMQFYLSFDPNRLESRCLSLCISIVASIPATNFKFAKIFNSLEQQI